MAIRRVHITKHIRIYVEFSKPFGTLAVNRQNSAPLWRFWRAVQRRISPWDSFAAMLPMRTTTAPVRHLQPFFISPTTPRIPYSSWRTFLTLHSTCFEKHAFFCTGSFSIIEHALSPARALHACFLHASPLWLSASNNGTSVTLPSTYSHAHYACEH